MRGGLRFRGLGLATGLMVVTLVVGCSSAESSDDPGDGAVPEGEGLASYDQIVLGGERPRRLRGCCSAHAGCRGCSRRNPHDLPAGAAALHGLQ